MDTKVPEKLDTLRPFLLGKLQSTFFTLLPITEHPPSTHHPPLRPPTAAIQDPGSAGAANPPSQAHAISIGSQYNAKPSK